jgi:hypothetical protein
MLTAGSAVRRARRFSTGCRSSRRPGWPKASRVSWIDCRQSSVSPIRRAMRRLIRTEWPKPGRRSAGLGKRSLGVVPQTSFLETPARYKRLPTEVGLEIIWERSGRDDALASFDQQTAAQQGSSALPPLGVHVTMGSGAVPKRAQELGATCGFDRPRTRRRTASAAASLPHVCARRAAV